ncbi:MAG: hypothetical protein KKC46_15980 [Proteobacteria bacterium]|nr:hypothetical protein [Pseudomonadota bacterium]
MENVGVKELRDSLSIILKKVENGEIIKIMRHGKAVAELKPLVTPSEQMLLNNLKNKGVLGGGNGNIGFIKSVKNKIPDMPVSDLITQDRK